MARTSQVISNKDSIVASEEKFPPLSISNLKLLSFFHQRNSYIFPLTPKNYHISHCFLENIYFYFPKSNLLFWRRIFFSFFFLSDNRCHCQRCSSRRRGRRCYPSVGHRCRHRRRRHYSTDGSRRCSAYQQHYCYNSNVRFLSLSGLFANILRRCSSQCRQGGSQRHLSCCGVRPYNSSAPPLARSPSPSLDVRGSTPLQQVPPSLFYAFRTNSTDILVLNFL